MTSNIHVSIKELLSLDMSDYIFCGVCVMPCEDDTTRAFLALVFEANDGSGMAHVPINVYGQGEADFKHEALGQVFADMFRKAPWHVTDAMIKALT